MSNDNDMLRCPFNANHTISRARFQRHLVKCEKNYPSDYKVICPYDATHRISKDKIVEHVETCPMRRIVEGSFIHSSSHDTVTSVKYDSASKTDYKDIPKYWNSKVEIEMTKSLGNPFKYLEPMDQTNGSITDDLESQVNLMSIGRGRRSNYNYYSDIESTEDDTDSMISAMGIGRGRMIANNIKYHHRFRLRGRQN